jgi:hypothetical protein
MPDNEQSAAFDAEAWMLGDTNESPSASWDHLKRK